MKKLLKDKRVLYFVFFLALTNLFHFMFTQNFNALSLFLVLGLLVSYFTKNMIIILVVSMLVTHLFRRNLREGLKNKNKDEDEDDKKEKKDKESFNDKQGLEGEKDAGKETYKHKGSGEGTVKDGKDKEDNDEDDEITMG